MKPKLIDYCSSGDDKVFSFEEYENYLKTFKQWKKLNSKEWEVIDIQLIELANKMRDNLNE